MLFSDKKQLIQQLEEKESESKCLQVIRESCSWFNLKQIKKACKYLQYRLSKFSL